MENTHKIQAISVSTNMEIVKDTTTATPLIPKGNPILLVLSFIALYLIWGGTYLAMRIGLLGFPPFLMASIRFLIAGGVLYLILRLRGHTAPNRVQWIGS